MCVAMSGDQHISCSIYKTNSFTFNKTTFFIIGYTNCETNGYAVGCAYFYSQLHAVGGLYLCAVGVP